MGQYKCTFIGTGIIGAGLASNALLRDLDVTIYDVVPEEKIRANMQSVFDILVESGAVTKEAAADKLSKARICTDLKEAVTGADFVQECVPERLDLKQNIYRQIQEVTGENAVIASSTSSMLPSKLQDGALYPEKIVVGHPYNPSYLLPLVEVCGGEKVPETTIDRVCDIYRAMGKAPCVCRKEVNGFIVNQLSWGALGAAMKCVQEGVCSVEDMDKAIMYGPGMRMAVLGQILTISLGIDGGIAMAPKKYGLPDDPIYAALGKGVEEELLNRSEEQGRNVEDVCKFRDKVFVQILKAQGML